MVHANLTVWNTFADASLAVMPGTIFWKLHCGRTKKFQLCVVFAFNILTSLCSGVKTKYLSQLSNRGDFTWATYNILVWQTVELFFMVVCGTLPTLIPLYGCVCRRLGKVTSLTDSSNLSSRKRRGGGGGGRYLRSNEEGHALEGAMREGGGARTTTTVEHFRTPSTDNLMGGHSSDEPPVNGVRVDVEYDVQSQRRSSGSYGHMVRIS